ncbi:hypothetical protein, partial [Pseudomonas aeruginosa]
MVGALLVHNSRIIGEG